MSSIIKFPFVTLSEQKKIIKSVCGDDDRIINNSFNLKESQDQIEDQQDDSELKESLSKDKEVEQESAKLKERALEDANQIVEDAKAKAATIENVARETGYKEGYEKGFEQGKEEAQQILKDELEQLQIEKNDFIQNLQPKIAEIIQSLVVNMIGIESFEPGVIMFLIKKGLEEVNLHGDLVIKVSPEDYDEVLNNIHTITENLSDKVAFEILRDLKLKKNDCIVETDYGNVNCGLGERMDGLMKQLQLIEKSFASHEG